MGEQPDSDEEARLDRNPVVLIVDDEEDLADLYSQWLTDDYIVRTAYDGEEALDQLDESSMSSCWIAECPTSPVTRL